MNNNLTVYVSGLSISQTELLRQIIEKLTSSAIKMGVEELPTKTIRSDVSKNNSSALAFILHEDLKPKTESLNIKDIYYIDSNAGIKEISKILSDVLQGDLAPDLIEQVLVDNAPANMSNTQETNVIANDLFYDDEDEDPFAIPLEDGTVVTQVVTEIPEETNREPEVENASTTISTTEGNQSTADAHKADEQLLQKVSTLEAKLQEALAQKAMIVNASAKNTEHIKYTKNYDVTFITALTPRSTVYMYEDIFSNIASDTAVIDLSSDSYIDYFVRFKSVIRPGKWLLEDKATFIDSLSKGKVNNKIFECITSATRPMPPESAAVIDWDAKLAEVRDTTKHSVYIILGTLVSTEQYQLLNKAMENNEQVIIYRGNDRVEQRIAFAKQQFLTGHTEERIVEVD